ncbi:ABC transporter ATP-binding protein [Streptosporangium sp. NBC_01755]|uniref:ABC transporter ATP-binding protein n=1 Tax=unclassified Streptosporangium TaxID=2632669 RepID=UPI002DD7C2ED|nr:MULTISPECIES: ABC transporter ATP-binding protein [unclassified Streptosporangium]WSA29007.1 ABC transporter ATP-binding protein [Streptosporangium sp. NBC_01810]WSC99546.1 ABC transporter ATP-binding protein [Streptosporangium sp. NBC_01755]
MDLRVDSVSKTYGNGSGARVALTGAAMTVGSQELVSIVGPSGCGKSTLLMIMAGLLRPSSGTVTLGEKVVDGPPMGLSVVFQDYSRSLFPWMTVRRNLTMAAAAYKLPKAELGHRVEHALESVGLPGSGNLYPYQMSGGMQQRVAIARALVVEPTVMLMDEPFAAVDAQTRADLEDLVLRVRDEYRVTIAFVTHDIDEAVYLADRVVVMAANPGRILNDIPVSLPKPRDQVETKLDPDFAALRSQVFQLVMRPGATQKVG